MKLTVRRPLVCGSEATIGNLYVDGVWECFTLEDTDRRLEDDGKKIYAKTAIPRGTYDVIIDHSNRFGRMLPHILDVPQFEGVRIHSGNTPDNTEGCILVGLSKVNDRFIGSSRAAFDRLFEKMERAIEQGDKITLEVA